MMMKFRNVCRKKLFAETAEGEHGVIKELLLPSLLSRLFPGL